MNKKHISFFLPELQFIQESTIQLTTQKFMHHATCISDKSYPLGSGYHTNRETAHTIAIAEGIERRIFQHLRNSAQQQEYLLDLYPTTCGFAVGSTRFETRQRSIAEAIERWIRSKWIDDHFRLEEISPPIQALGLHETFLASQFQSLRAFRHSTEALSFKGEILGRFHSLIVVGYKNGGAFVGSRTSNNPNSLWEHALVEAWRHLRIFENHHLYPDTFDFRIINYFGTNETLANKQIESATLAHLPSPELRLCKEVETGFTDLYCYRSLCENFKGWHTDEIQRFVY